MPDNPSSRRAGEYRGRFAPSPTGPLHFGSLVAAVASYLCARAAGGRWFIRIEDLDPPREVPGASSDILRTLEIYGLHWDGEVMYQSRRAEVYAAALEQLRQRDAVYACACTRKEIADSSLRGIEGPVYPGTCRHGSRSGRTQHALRVRTDSAGIISFEDRWQGPQQCVLAREVGDFVVRRADGLIAYQLACVADDAAQGITEVVRGADLLTSTPRQIHLQRLLGLRQPSYLHLPVVLDEKGEKLSKQTFAAPISADPPVPTLVRALRFLGVPSEQTWMDMSVAEFWPVAMDAWCGCVRASSS